MSDAEKEDVSESVELKPKTKAKQKNWEFTEQRKINLAKARETRKQQSIEKKIKELEELKEMMEVTEKPSKKKTVPGVLAKPKKKVVIVEESSDSASSSSVEVVVQKKKKEVALKQSKPPQTHPQSRFVFL